MKVRLLLSVLLLAIIIAGSIILTQEVLRVRGVVVIGCEERPAHEVTALSGIVFEESIFKVDQNAVKERVEESPYYEVREVGLVYPDKVSITVHERRPRAVIQYLGGIIVMDEQGFILEVRKELGGIRCPVVSGMTVSSFKVGQKVATSNDAQIPAMRAVLNEMIEQDCTQMISELIIKDVNDIRMVTRDGYEVKIGGPDDLTEKIRYMRSAIPMLAADGHVGGTLYLVTVRSAVYQPPGSGGISGRNSQVSSDEGEEETPTEIYDENEYVEAPEDEPAP